MYNEKYINDFEEKKYLDYLGNRWALKEIADSYINQYSNPTYDCTIAFKESLDHYILKQIKTNPDFLKTQYFKNYLAYINYTFSKRINSANTQLEYNTNIIFSDSITKNIILSYYNDTTRNKLIEIIEENENRIKYVSDKLFSGKKVSQLEMDFIGDYLYTKKDLNSALYHKYIEYLLNNIKGDDQINNSPQIIAAYIAYLPKVFGDGCEHSRILLTNGYSSSKVSSILPSVLNDIIKKETGKSNSDRTVKNLKLYSCGDKYISISKKELYLSLSSDKSLDISRTTNFKDLYWISMVCFHELTHQYQNRQMRNKKFNSSGFSIILKMLINNKNDYDNNHDSYEMEIEADEISWKKMYDFIVKYRLRNSNAEKREYIREQLKKCQKNQKSVYARRTFLTRQDDNNQELSFFQNDMSFIKNNLKNNSDFFNGFKKARKLYPMLQKVFTESGEIDPTLLLKENITSTDRYEIDNNIMGSEIATYILTSNYDSLKEHIIQDNLTESQIQNLMLNIYNSYHLEKMYVEALSQITLQKFQKEDEDIKYYFDFKTYEDTTHHFNFNNIRDKYLEKFKSVAFLVYKERELINIIKRRYPNYNRPVRKGFC